MTGAATAVWSDAVLNDVAFEGSPDDAIVDVDAQSPSSMVSQRVSGGLRLITNGNWNSSKFNDCNLMNFVQQVDVDEDAITLDLDQSDV